MSSSNSGMKKDSMIMAWLWNSMVVEIGDTCMFLRSAKEIWEALDKPILRPRMLLKFMM